jgi:hypothetical protein
MMGRMKVQLETAAIFIAVIIRAKKVSESTESVRKQAQILKLRPFRI